MEERSIGELKDGVEAWAKAVGIYGGDFLPQFKKFREEVEEFSNELVECNEAGEFVAKETIDRDAMEEELGDTLVTLLLLPAKLDTTIEECLGRALNKIMKRIGKGRVIDGKFVKEEDFIKFLAPRLVFDGAPIDDEKLFKVQTDSSEKEQ